MDSDKLQNIFTEKARIAGSEVIEADSPESAIEYISRHLNGELMMPLFPSAEHTGMVELAENAGIRVITDNFREKGPGAEGGLTGASFAIAETGTIVIESTDEKLRLASSLPEKHFVLLDKSKILGTSMDAIPLLRRFNDSIVKNYLAYITGPSRTADIERVLTIGVHGPKELHIIIMSGFSGNKLEI